MFIAAESDRVKAITKSIGMFIAAESDRVKAITKSIGMFIAADTRPYSVVGNKGFKNMVKVLEIVPDLYEQEKINCRRIIQGILCWPHHRRVVLQGNGKLRDCDCLLHHRRVVLQGNAKLRDCDCLLHHRRVVLQGNGKLRDCDCLLHHRQVVLQGNGKLRDCDCSLHHRGVGDAKSGATDTPPQSHRDKSGAGTARSTVAEWKLERPNSNIPITTDNAKNQANAMIEDGLEPQIACFAHGINLASQRGISVTQMDRQQPLMCLRPINKCYSYRPTSSYTMSQQDGTPLMTCWSAILSSRQPYTQTRP
ncbi:uncharacterized protein LOC115203742 [Salmo trutta]|uniref:uncharacterized protein LOC115203742 n=1 Tax=Salmo trutta TaxID=8032 RepID=UPI001131F927|nr:uncharacterized protein LOC115203742 [Salmo trutta]